MRRMQNAHSIGLDERRWASYAVLALILLSILDRIDLLVRFAFTHIGIDDALMQQIALDYSHGIFREPYMYGQNYNPMLEALLAVPMLWAGISPQFALPIVTSFLALIPFWTFAWWCLRQGHVIGAIAFSAMPILLPVEWGMLTSMPRGFVHGIGLLALLPIIHFIKTIWVRSSLTALVASAVVVCNPNALLVIVPMFSWLILKQWRSEGFWLGNLLGVLPSAGFVLWAKAFHTNAKIAPLHFMDGDSVQYSFNRTWSGLQDLDRHWQHLVPFIQAAGLLMISLLLIAAVVAFKRNYREQGWAIVAVMLFIPFALGILKVHEGMTTIFFSLSRMFLGIPILVAGCIAMIGSTYSIDRRTLTGVFMVIVIWLPMKWNEVNEVVVRELENQDEGYVREEPTEVVRSYCRTVSDVATHNGAQLIVPIRWPDLRVDHRTHYVAHFVCYACPQMESELPPVFMAGYDRRTWVVEAYGAAKCEKVLFVGGDPEAWRIAMIRDSFIKDVSTKELIMHMVENSSVSILDLMSTTHVDGKE